MEPIVHYLIPLVFLLVVFPKVNKKLAFSLATLTLIMDFEYYTKLHRQLTHNLLFLIITSIIIYFLINKEAVYLSIYFIGSHLILDSAYPGTALLWPIYNKAFYMTTELTSNFIFNIKFGIADLTLRKPTISYIIGTESIIFLALILILLLIKYRKKIISIINQSRFKIHTF